jgi:hypothetical protein
MPLTIVYRSGKNDPIVRSGNAMLTDQLICFGVLG